MHKKTNFPLISFYLKLFINNFFRMATLIYIYIMKWVKQEYTSAFYWQNIMFHAKAFISCTQFKYKLDLRFFGIVTLRIFEETLILFLIQKKVEMFAVSQSRQEVFSSMRTFVHQLCLLVEGGLLVGVENHYLFQQAKVALFVYWSVGWSFTNFWPGYFKLLILLFF